jgi:hypothetical protein
VLNTVRKPFDKFLLGKADGLSGTERGWWRVPDAARRERHQTEQKQGVMGRSKPVKQAPAFSAPRDSLHPLWPSGSERQRPRSARVTKPAVHPADPRQLSPPASLGFFLPRGASEGRDGGG